MNFKEMTDQQINKAVAEKVMGWKYHEKITKGVVVTLIEKWYADSKGNKKEYPFSPSTDPVDTYLVIEALKEKGWGSQVMNYVKKDARVFVFNGEYSFLADNKSWLRALSEASLKAMEDKNE